MKHLIILSTAALLLGACASTYSSDKAMDDESDKMSSESSMTESDMKEESMEMNEETMMDDEMSGSAEDSMETMEPLEPAETMEAPAPAPAASVDCTGLSDDECIAKVMNFGNEPAAAEPEVMEESGS